MIASTPPRGMGIVLSAISMAGLASCQAPIGMYGHRPEELWTLRADAVPVSIARCTYSGSPIVLKRLENAARVPVGAHFVGVQPSPNSMEQAYAPAGDLAMPIFETVYASLRSAHFPVWKDYSPSPEGRRAPPGSTTFMVVHGVVEELEVSTFEIPAEVDPAHPLDDAARATITLTVEDATGKVRKRFVAEPKVRLRRGSGDVLVALGQRVAQQMAEVFNAGL